MKPHPAHRPPAKPNLSFSYLAGVLLLILFPFAGAAANSVVLTFEDLPAAYSSELSAHYAGLTWDDFVNQVQPVSSRYWVLKSESIDPQYSQPHSGDNYLLPSYGNNYLGFSLPHSSDALLGAWFTDAAPTAGAGKVRFNGFDASHNLVQQSVWLTLTSTPQYLAANFTPVARIEIEDFNVAGFYALDDLAYSVPEPSCLAFFSIALACKVLFFSRRHP